MHQATVPRLPTAAAVDVANNAPPSPQVQGLQPASSPQTHGTAPRTADGFMHNAPQQQQPRASSANAVLSSPAPRSAAALRDQLIERLTTEDALLAASLMHTGGWTWTGGVVTATADSVFLQNQLEAQRSRLSACLSQLCGEQVAFVVNVKAAAPQNRDTMPLEVQLLCTVFKGAVVGVAPKTENELRQQQQSAQQPEHAADTQSEANSETEESDAEAD